MKTKHNSVPHTRKNIEHIKQNIKSKIKVIRACREVDIEKGVKRTFPITSSEIHIALSEVVLEELNAQLTNEQLEEVIIEAHKIIKPGKLVNNMAIQASCIIDCPDCDGTGSTKKNEECPHCLGSGQI